MAARLGNRQIFFTDATTFIIAAIFILSPSSLLIERNQKGFYCTGKVWADIIKGTRLLFSDKAIRFVLLIELVAATAGAQILVNTMGFIKGRLQLTYKHYSM